MEQRGTGRSSHSLDPSDWSELRSIGHQMLDDMIDHLEHIRDRPVWRPMSAEVRTFLHRPLPRNPTGLREVYRIFVESVLPFTLGNLHPGFMGWAHGGGTPVGLLAEMIAGAVNANLAGRDHAPVEVEKQVVQWVRELFHFPQSSRGLFVTGTSMGNLIAVLVARTAAIGGNVRARGVSASGKRLTAYASTCAHLSVVRALEVSGIGSTALRPIPVNTCFQIDLEELARAIDHDLESGFTPFLIVGTAGTTDVGAVDDLASLAEIARVHGLWFHVDGAIGALAVLAPEIAPRLRGIEEADSIAFDFHKWAQVPYDTGFVIVRDGSLQERTFTREAGYLRREGQGMAAGSPWACDLGPDLSRGFKALKTWFTLEVYGTDRLGEVIANTCHLAQYMRRCIEKTSELEILAPVSLNIVCFGYRCTDRDKVNAEIVVALQESGIAAPSSATVNGHVSIRAAIFNHRTETQDIDRLVDAAVRFGREAVLNGAGALMQ